MAVTRKVKTWRKIRAWWATPAVRRMRTTGTVVFLGAAYVSAGHIITVAGSHGQEGLAPYLYPLMIDAMLIVSAKYIAGSKTRTGSMIAYVSFGMGAIMTVAANLLSAGPAMWDKIVAVVPAVTVVLTAGQLHWGEMIPRVKPVSVRSSDELLLVRAVLKAHRKGESLVTYPRGSTAVSESANGRVPGGVLVTTG
jgi:hypothetical protein